MKKKKHDAVNYANNKNPSLQEHWVKDVGASVFARGYGNDPAGAFLARPGKDRARPHIKINECDH